MKNSRRPIGGLVNDAIFANQSGDSSVGYGVPLYAAEVGLNDVPTDSGRQTAQ